MAWPAQAIIEFAAKYRVNNQVCMNVTHWAPQGDSSAGDIPELTQAFLDQNSGVGNGSFIHALVQLQSNDVTIFEVSAQLIHPTRWQKRVKVVNVVGDIDEPCPAQNLAITFTKTGDRANRHNVGSLHVGGCPVGLFDEGLLTAAAKTRAEAMESFIISELTDAISEAVYDMVILNKEPVPDSDPVRYAISGYSPVTGGTVEDTVRVMRRRTVGLGI